MRGDRDIAFGGGTGGGGIILGVAPDVADDVIRREADLLRGFQRHRVHHAPAAQNHPVGFFPANVEPLRLLLVAWMGHFQQGQLEPVLVGQGLQHLIGFLAVGRAVIQGDDLLALELVQASGLLADVVDDRRHLGIRVQLQREGIGEHAAVSGIGTAVVDGNQRQFVRGRALQRGIGNAHRQRIGRGGRRAIEAFFQAFIALHALLDHVLGFALAPGQLDPVHPAVGVDVLEVVDEAAEEAGATGGIGADPVTLQREVLLAGRLDGEGGGREAERQGQAAGESAFVHRASPCRNRLACVRALAHGVRSVAQRPEPCALAESLPEARESLRLLDQEEDDQRAEHYLLQVLQLAGVDQPGRQQRGQVR
ncbi:hypothetical protein D3C85_1000100 [compost metagenome]